MSDRKTVSEEDGMSEVTKHMLVRISRVNHNSAEPTDWPSLSEVKELVEEGADVHAVHTQYSYTTLHYASEYEPPRCEEGLAIVKFLVSKGVDHTKKDFSGDLPIHLAAKFNNLPVLRYWIEEKDVNIEVTNYNGSTPLHFASNHNSLDLMGYLVVCKNANLLAKTKVCD